MEKVQYGTTTIEFQLQWVNRKTLGIEVHPDLSVWAIAPINTDLDEIKTKIEKRAKWILKQKQYFEEFLPRTPERLYESGETHLYLGRRCVLKVKEGAISGVKLKGAELIVTVNNKQSKSAVKRQLTAWYYDHATVKFKSILENRLTLFQSHSIQYPQLEIRRMKNRWGSCNSNGKIIINPELIKAPSHCIEYVITHELCHLIQPNHNQKFYELQSAKMPDWKKWKDKLEKLLV